MIWYILYPFRGTTEPPRLATSHPLRRLFQAHGTATARHWLLSILLTVLISVLLCYPAIFHTDSRAAAALRNLPKHVWTSTTEAAANRTPDVDVRQVWVHGDYMEAIDKRVLHEALHVQHVLFGDGSAERALATHTATAEQSGCHESTYGFTWGFHSPLMYWNCSHKAIEQDHDLLATINSHSADQSALRLTLRPSTVFAGKAFVNQKLRAADALVITLFDEPTADSADRWESRSRQLPAKLGHGWTIYPPDAHTSTSRLYEFRFKPMTLNDDLLLACSYMVTAVYVIWRLMQLRAVKSKSGLLITICAKMTICVIASFTICTYLGIGLARIPRPWFPGVVFCFGLGNIFRLINVVLQTPPEMLPAQRIGYALGEVGHLSLAVAGQNLVLIWLCSRVVTPMVADFCVFAAVTLVLDFVYHLTFFVAVLSVDVQRMELQDSLERVDLIQLSRNGRQERQTWISALRQGTVPVSTRFAGTAAILSMILAVNWHFFDSDSRKLNPRDILGSFSKRSLSPPQTGIAHSPPINQARTPAEWFRIQNHNTARELVGFIKPSGHSFVARVYDPLLIVLDGAKGRDAENKSQSCLRFLKQFAHEHAFPAALIVVSLIAGVTLLMNYLLWTGVPDDLGDHEEDDDTYLSVKTLPVLQTLDVVRLASCPKGHLVSISLDKSTSLWLNERGPGPTNAMLETAKLKPRLWPLVACTIDAVGQLLALCSDTGQIGLWSIPARRFLSFPIVELHGHNPLLFSFITQHNSVEQEAVSLVVVTPDGYLSMVNARTGQVQTKRICSVGILSGTLYSDSKAENSFVFVSKPGDVYIIPLKVEGDWTPEVVAGLDPGPPPGKNPFKIKAIFGVPTLGLIFAIRAEEVEVVDFTRRALIHSLKVGRAKPCSLRVMHSSRRPCPCGASSVRTLAIAYAEQDTDAMVMRTYFIDDTTKPQLCLGKSSGDGTHSCKGWQQAAEQLHRVESAGVWESTSALSVVGIRKVEVSSTPSDFESSSLDPENGHYTAEPSTLAAALTQRAAKEKEGAGRNGILASLDAAFHARTHKQSSLLRDSDGWEAWALSATGEFLSRPLFTEDEDDDTAGSGDFELEKQLFVACAGPITRIRNKSVAVGFGNSVKVISLGKESTFHGPMAGRSEDKSSGIMGFGNYKSRSRRTGRKIS